MCKILISILFFLLSVSAVFSKEISFVSISPAMTEIMFSIGAQDKLKAVSSQCNFPVDAKEKPIIGDSYFINESMLIKLKPLYFLAPDSSAFLIDKYKKLGITPLCLKYTDINSIYENILFLGELTQNQDNAEKLVKQIKRDIKIAASLNNRPNKKILYVVSLEPFRTIGRKSFITSVIEASGNYSVTGEIDTFYPAISLEYAISHKPDIIVVDYYCRDGKEISSLFPDMPIVRMTKLQSDIINRPATRIHKSVEFFATLGNGT